jgi:hypothetical protein
MWYRAAFQGENEPSEAIVTAASQPQGPLRRGAVDWIARHNAAPTDEPSGLSAPDQLVVFLNEHEQEIQRFEFLHRSDSRIDMIYVAEHKLD